MAWLGAVWGCGGWWYLVVADAADLLLWPARRRRAAARQLGRLLVAALRVGKGKGWWVVRVEKRKGWWVVWRRPSLLYLLLGDRLLLLLRVKA